MTTPWKGMQEMMLRTIAGAARVAGLTIDKAVGGQIELSWSASCLPTDIDYAIYEGDLGVFDSHQSRFCSTGAATTKTFTPLAGNAYYLVVPLNAIREGSYGTDSNDMERPQGANACLAQVITACP